MCGSSPATRAEKDLIRHGNCKCQAHDAWSSRRQRPDSPRSPGQPRECAPFAARSRWTQRAWPDYHPAQKAAVISAYR